MDESEEREPRPGPQPRGQAPGERKEQIEIVRSGFGERSPDYRNVVVRSTLGKQATWRSEKWLNNGQIALSLVRAARCGRRIYER